MEIYIYIYKYLSKLNHVWVRQSEFLLCRCFWCFSRLIYLHCCQSNGGSLNPPKNLRYKRKSELLMGDFISAITNIHGKFRFIPKFIFNVKVRKIWFVVPSAACNVLLPKEVLELCVGGMQLISAPYQLRNFCLILCREYKVDDLIWCYQLGFFKILLRIDMVWHTCIPVHETWSSNSRGIFPKVIGPSTLWKLGFNRPFKMYCYIFRTGVRIFCCFLQRL